MVTSYNSSECSEEGREAVWMKWIRRKWRRERSTSFTPLPPRSPTAHDRKKKWVTVSAASWERTFFRGMGSSLPWGRSSLHPLHQVLGAEWAAGERRGEEPDVGWRGYAHFIRFTKTQPSEVRMWRGKGSSGWSHPSIYDMRIIWRKKEYKNPLLSSTEPSEARWGKTCHFLHLCRSAVGFL